MTFRHFILVFSGALVGLAVGVGMGSIRGKPRARARLSVAPDASLANDSTAHCQEELLEKTSNNACLLEFLQEGDASTSAKCQSFTCTRIQAPEDIAEPTLDEWKAFARQEHVQFYLPCPVREDWIPDDRDRAELGLSPAETQALGELYRASGVRLWSKVKPICAEALNIDPNAAERLGLTHCSEVLDARTREDADLLRYVAEVRGRIPSEMAPEYVSAPGRYVLARLDEANRFEADLSRRIGSDTARIVARAGSFCAGPRNPHPRRYTSPSATELALRCRDQVMEAEAETRRLSRRLYRRIGRPVDPYVEYKCLARDTTPKRPPTLTEDRSDLRPEREEWKALAEQGTLKFGVPCRMPDGFTPPADEAIVREGLTKIDIRNLGDAYKRSTARIQSMESTACAEVLMITLDSANRIGSKTCLAILEEQWLHEDPSIFRVIAEIRSGERAREPVTLSPLARYYLGLTEEMDNFEADLARLGGIERARKIMASPLACFDRVELPPHKE
ncbi:hypothetical protein LZC95_33710 [Pendulispora brunnea]|uniref:Uncharacterized protein n=1 Tax=Pendulispora brunnea TaxID=2905690 RepID=A0ABZ2K4Y0_9BACT